MMVILFQSEFSESEWGDFSTPPQVVDSYHDRMMSMSPLAYWRLNDVAGGVAADSAGAIEGTYVGGVVQAESGSLYRESDVGASFDGFDGKIQTANSSVLDGATSCTILFWMKHGGATVVEDGGVVSRLASNAGFAIWVDVNSGGTPRTLTFMVYPSSLTAQTSRLSGGADLVGTGQWDFYACVFAGSEFLRIYKNAELRAENTTDVIASIPAGGAPLTIADGNFGSIGSIHAELDEVAILSQALRTDEIEQLYHIGLGHPGIATV